MTLTPNHTALDGQDAARLSGLPGISVYAIWLLRCVMICLAPGHPLRRNLRQFLDMLQIYNLSITLDAAALIARARYYSLMDMIADCAPAPTPSRRAELLRTVSGLPDLKRVTPKGLVQTGAAYASPVHAERPLGTAKVRAGLKTVYARILTRGARGAKIHIYAIPHLIQFRSLSQFRIPP